MERYFNTEGLCDPEEHYMVRLDDRLRQIKRLFVDRGKYFVINRGRQYGKTTTLRALENYLREDYVVLFMDFQLLTDADFENERMNDLLDCDCNDQRINKKINQKYSYQGKK